MCQERLCEEKSNNGQVHIESMYMKSTLYIYIHIYISELYI